MKASKEKKLELLRLVRKTITIKDVGICCVLQMRSVRGYNELESNQLIGYISDQLVDSVYLEGWVKKRVGNWQKVEPQERKEKMFATRLTWLDWMIACYEEDLK